VADDNKIIIAVDLTTGNVEKTLKDTEKQAKKSGEKAGKNLEDGFKRGFNGVRAAALSAVTAITTAFAGRALIRAAAVQEDAVNSLNSALISTGIFSDKTSQSLQNFASELQNATRFGDEVILQNAALIQSLGRLDEQGLKRATTAATNLATALRIDLSTASQLVGKAAQGQITAFSRYGIAIEKGRDATETFNNTLKAIESRFSGAASRDVLTFSGAWQQLTNVFGDLLEELGMFITKSPEITLLIKAIKDELLGATGSVKQFRESFSIINDILIPLTEIGNTITQNVIPPMELLYNIGKIVFSAINSAVATTIAIIGQLGGAVGSLLNKLGVFKEMSQGLQDFADTSEATALEVNKSLTENIAGAFDFPISETLTNKNEELRVKLVEMNAIIAEQSNASKEAMTNSMNEIAASNENMSSSFFDTFANMQLSFELTTEQMIANARQLGATIRDLALNGFGRSFQAIGAALASGQNANQAFVNSVKQTASEAASAFGDYYIKLGIARLAAGDPGGAATVAGGAALKVLAGALGASAASSSSGGTVGVPIGGGQFAMGSLSDPQQTQQREERSSINLTIQGDVLDSEESGMRISKLLSDAGAKTGVVLRDARLV
jgi:hypothetical protein